MPTHPDQRYIEGLLYNDGSTVDEIYRKYAGAIRKFIIKNGGSGDDAADIFQEALIDLYNQARHKDLQLTCPFEAFLVLVCKRKWYNLQKKRGLHRVTNSTDEVSQIGEDPFARAEQLALEESRARLFLEQFARLGERCREILKLSLTGEAQEKIAERLSVTYGYLRKKKSECMATLLSYIQAQNS
ncbi:MAG TPA: sigma-70 family RNA polymerase sigma factor [Puia sp.]|jgi:RNA polymerase sigma factor (sigma-70 family)|nr:sigma-70 family RNA polymerase sigma factor [Puia sp.]